MCRPEATELDARKKTEQKGYYRGPLIFVASQVCHLRTH